jgi:hypothetical protein
MTELTPEEERDIVSAMVDLLGNGYVTDYYISAASDFIHIARCIKADALKVNAPTDDTVAALEKKSAEVRRRLANVPHDNHYDRGYLLGLAHGLERHALELEDD